MENFITLTAGDAEDAEESEDGKESNTSYRRGRGGNMTENEIGTVIVDSALKVHSAFGAGLLESVYEACLEHELLKRGLTVARQVPCSITYDGDKIESAFRLDLVVQEKVVVEVKAVEKLLPVHTAQVMTYLKLSNLKLGYLLNFNVVHMKDGINRVVNNL